MNKKLLTVLWGVMFALCAGLGFIALPEEGADIARAAMALAALLFFAPGAMLLYGAVKRHNKRTLLIIRNLSAASLIVTTVLIVLNILSLMAPEAIGILLHVMLVIASAPLFCAQQGMFGAVSIFLWACLLTVSIAELKKYRRR